MDIPQSWMSKTKSCTCLVDVEDSMVFPLVFPDDIINSGGIRVLQ